MGRSSRSEGYVLRGGRAERLRLLNRVKWPTTEPLLRAAGLRAGMSCLDVGCGSGDVTLKMAALVGAEGNVVGVDRDQSILQLASQEAERQGLQVTDEYHQEGGSAYRRSPLLTQMAQGMTSSSIHPTSGSARTAKS
ncbi:MAG TPA: methyltransferase domain-containing protein [Rubrobacter sp.]